MKTTVWIKKKIVIFVGGDPNKGQSPELTIEIQNPQILIDSTEGKIIILETEQKG